MKAVITRADISGLGRKKKKGEKEKKGGEVS